MDRLTSCVRFQRGPASACEPRPRAGPRKPQVSPVFHRRFATSIELIHRGP